MGLRKVIVIVKVIFSNVNNKDSDENDKLYGNSKNVDTPI